MTDLGRYQQNMEPNDKGDWVDYEEAMDIIKGLEYDIDDLKDNIDALEKEKDYLESEIKQLEDQICDLKS